MPENCSMAAMRHFTDGELLYTHDRISNADQLYGFAVECAIKSALVGLPVCTAGGVLSDRYREHVGRLWDLTPLQGLQKRHETLVMVLKGFRQSFANWSTDQRYEADNAITDAAAELHRKVARRVLGSVGLLGVLRET